MGKLSDAQKQIQEGVESFINEAEKQYATIAVKPFELAEQVPFELNIAKYKGLHDDAVANLCNTLRDLNKQLGELSAELIAKVEKEETVTEKATSTVKKAATTAKKTATKKATAAKRTVKKAAAKVEKAVEEATA